MSFTETTKSHRKSGGSRGTCCAPFPARKCRAIHSPESPAKFGGGTCSPAGICVIAGFNRNRTGAPFAYLPRLAVGAYVGRKRWGVPDFLYAALDAIVCAAFFKESRMKCAGATKLHRKSGDSPTIAFAESPQIHGEAGKSNRNISFSAQVRSHGKPGQVGEPGALVLFL